MGGDMAKRDLIEWTKETDFFDYKITKPEISAWTNYPKFYKFTSLQLLISYDQVITERETYDMLEYLGDLGGLMEALLLIGHFIMAPILAYSVKNQLATLIFKQKIEE